MRRVSIVVAARHPIVLHGLETLLSSKSDFIVVASCQDGRKCLQIIRDLSPDIALLEMSLPGLTGLDILDIVESERLSTRVVFFPAAAGDRDMMIAATRGAYGFVPNETAPDDLVELLRQVANGQRVSPLMSCTSPREDGCAAGKKILASLTHRERQIMDLVCQGLSNKAIGRRLNTSEGTIKVHLHNIYQKLAIDNRTALAALACSLRLHTHDERPFARGNPPP